MALDVLLRGDESQFPHPAYVIGLSAEWVFAEPFDTRPIDFVPVGEWQTQTTREQTNDAIDYVVSLLQRDGSASRFDS
jgi:hypothetical protein